MRKEIEIQQENLNNLAKLMSKNPTLEVKVMVDSEVVGSDGYSWWLGKFGEAELDEYYCSDERIYFRSWDEEELIDDILDGYGSEYNELSDEELVKKAEKEVNHLAWEKFILVKINLP